MIVLDNIEMVMFDFDDTLCIHQKHAYSEKDNREYQKCVLKKSEHLWSDCDINKQMKVFMQMCADYGMHMGLISAVELCSTGALKAKWVEKKYGFSLEGCCVGRRKDKTDMLIALSDAYSIPRERIMIVDDHPMVIEDVALAGFVAVTPMQVVNYVNSIIY